MITDDDRMTLFVRDKEQTRGNVGAKWIIKMVSDNDISAKSLFSRESSAFFLLRLFLGRRRGVGSIRGTLLLGGSGKLKLYIYDACFVCRSFIT